ncbi:hypothetical protein PM082_000758 [Marasmius tenuissimus]|nr:hypothetical protein PM082_000758 [Marasmius tenuissimus]
MPDMNSNERVPSTLRKKLSHSRGDRESPSLVYLCLAGGQLWVATEKIFPTTKAEILTLQTLANGVYHALILLVSYPAEFRTISPPEHVGFVMVYSCSALQASMYSLTSKPGVPILGIITSETTKQVTLFTAAYMPYLAAAVGSLSCCLIVLNGTLANEGCQSFTNFIRSSRLSKVLVSLPICSLMYMLIQPLLRFLLHLTLLLRIPFTSTLPIQHNLPMHIIATTADQKKALPDNDVYILIASD